MSSAFLYSFGAILDAARDKYAHFREINSTAAMFQYLQKNYNPTDSSFL
ncbi:glucosamine-6-phosphate deaminase [Salmonella enterica]|nr:glucosamine-6-phosphate deaminase [Salmonella enterica]